MSDDKGKFSRSMKYDKETEDNARAVGRKSSSPDDAQRSPTSMYGDALRGEYYVQSLGRRSTRKMKKSGKRQ